MLKLKNLRPKDFADYTCQVSVRNVCNIEDKSVTFRLTNATSKLFVLFCFILVFSDNKHMLEILLCVQTCTYRKQKFFLTFSIPCGDFCTFYFCDYPISADFSLHACILAEELLFTFAFKCLLSCQENSILLSSHFLSLCLSGFPCPFIGFSSAL